MNVFRIFLFLSGAFIGGWLVKNLIEAAFYHSNIIRVAGLLNMWGSYVMLLIFPYFTIYTIKERFELSLNIGEINKVGIVLVLIVAPLLAMGTYSKAQSNVESYVECKSERKISSRYSSRTYAVNEELCLTLNQHE
ncbi:hypothetical protein Q5N41_07315 [Vibrio cholerae]|uniref:hypothetical protein n=1 Tax=Vibrio cholerae TaxID=666 RepID=UPI00293476C2|nr:hypothetical protein [Vibrio cholerae]MDV2356975.1 hypothetical protein [Vibrio cholerae]MDV2378190.1 hypothetical protein [Vibrio cholerae]